MYTAWFREIVETDTVQFSCSIFTHSFMFHNFMLMYIAQFHGIVEIYSSMFLQFRVELCIIQFCKIVERYTVSRLTFSPLYSMLKWRWAHRYTLWLWGRKPPSSRCPMKPRIAISSGTSPTGAHTQFIQ